MLGMGTHFTAILPLSGFHVSISGDCQVSLFLLILPSGVLILSEAFISTVVACATLDGTGQPVNTGVAASAPLDGYWLIGPPLDPWQDH